MKRRDQKRKPTNFETNYVNLVLYASGTKLARKSDSKGTSAKLGSIETSANGSPTVGSESSCSTQGILVQVVCDLGKRMPEMFSKSEDLPEDWSPTTTTPGIGIDSEWHTARTRSNKPNFFETCAIASARWSVGTVPDASGPISCFEILQPGSEHVCKS